MRKKVFVAGNVVLTTGQHPLRPIDLSTMLLQVRCGTEVEVRMLNIVGWIGGDWGETPKVLRDIPGDGDVVILGISGRPHIGKDAALDNGEAIVIRCGSSGAKVILVYADMDATSAPDPDDLSTVGFQAQRYDFPAISSDEPGDHTAELIALLGRFFGSAPEAPIAPAAEIEPVGGISGK